MSIAHLDSALGVKFYVKDSISEIFNYYDPFPNYDQKTADSTRGNFRYHSFPDSVEKTTDSILEIIREKIKINVSGVEVGGLGVVIDTSTGKIVRFDLKLIFYSQSGLDSLREALQIKYGVLFDNHRGWCTWVDKDHSTLELLNMIDRQRRYTYDFIGISYASPNYEKLAKLKAISEKQKNDEYKQMIKESDF
jgi:hypothetical protein